MRTKQKSYNAPDLGDSLSVPKSDPYHIGIWYIKQNMQLIEHPQFIYGFK